VWSGAEHDDEYVEPVLTPAEHQVLVARLETVEAALKRSQLVVGILRAELNND
jgi:hypothetical protein